MADFPVVHTLVAPAIKLVEFIQRIFLNPFFNCLCSPYDSESNKAYIYLYGKLAVSEVSLLMIIPQTFFMTLRLSPALRTPCFQ